MNPDQQDTPSRRSRTDVETDGSAGPDAIKLERLQRYRAELKRRTVLATVLNLVQLWIWVILSKISQDEPIDSGVLVGWSVFTVCIWVWLTVLGIQRLRLWRRHGI